MFIKKISEESSTRKNPAETPWEEPGEVARGCQETSEDLRRMRRRQQRSKRPSYGRGKSSFRLKKGEGKGTASARRRKTEQKKGIQCVDLKKEEAYPIKGMRSHTN